MRTTILVLALHVAIGVNAFAQDDLFDGDVFLGYSLFRVNSAQQKVPAFFANGGVGTIAWNINNHLGIEAEVAGHHNGSTFDTTTFSYLFGPRISYGRPKRFDPYLHVLLGGMHLETSIDARSALVPTPHPLPAPSSGRYESSQDNFALAVGGGIDIKVNHHILFRPVQIDYLHTQFQTPTFLVESQGLAPSTNKNQHNVRFATGFVFNWNDESVHQ
ncbi:MAG: outer membrane beta-barrel protein [Bryobacteraceae bacterium]